MKLIERTYIVKCPICGKELCDCNSESNINIRCVSCKTPLNVVRQRNRLVVAVKENDDYQYRAK